MEGAPAATATLPPGAACAVHEIAATFVCTRCGTFGCPACVFSPVPRREVCRACAAGGLDEPIPWERWRELGALEALLGTARLVLRSPTAFFRTPSTADNVFSSVVFGGLTFTLGLLFSYLVAGLLVMLGGGAAALVMRDQGGETIGGLLGMYGCIILGMSPLALLAGPANALIALVVSAGASHGFLALFKKTRGGFQDTLRVVSYANSPYLLAWVPVLGSAGWFWMVGLEVIGLRETHKCGTDWAIGAALVYRGVLLLSMIGLYGIVVGGFFLLLRQRASGG